MFKIDYRLYKRKDNELYKNKYKICVLNYILY